MVALLYIVSGVVLLVAAVWVAGVLFISDFALPSQALDPYRNVLFVFPHADDEVNLAGLAWRLHRQGARTTLITLTKGERGTPDAHLDESLKPIREREVQAACQLLGITAHLQADFGDGQVVQNRAAVRTYIDSALRTLQPDLVVTYDLAGFYGHEDHIVCSEVILELLGNRHPTVPLWHIALTKRLLRVARLPEHMAKDEGFRERRAVARFKVFTGLGIIPKLQAMYAHKSQSASARSSVPFKLPRWYAYSMLLFEYFEAVIPSEAHRS